MIAGCCQVSRCVFLFSSQQQDACCDVGYLADFLFVLEVNSLIPPIQCFYKSRIYSSKCNSLIILLTVGMACTFILAMEKNIVKLAESQGRYQMMCQIFCLPIFIISLIYYLFLYLSCINYLSTYNLLHTCDFFSLLMLCPLLYYQAPVMFTSPVISFGTLLHQQTGQRARHVVQVGHSYHCIPQERSHFKIRPTDVLWNAF